MKKRHILLIVLTFALIISANIQPAIAYFTTFVRAQGGYQITVGDTTKIKEKIKGKDKEVVIHSEEGSEPVYVRAKVLYTGPYDLTVSGENWTGPTDDYYYYTPILKAGEDTTTLKVTIEALLTGEDATKDLKDGDSFSVVVVYETTPVRYAADGKEYADWDAQVIQVGSTTGGNG
ncbi:MAG: hypothetical protein IJV40_02530 [Oscillospiraceae bacterium]|nr:hypothetical protein [Oscillospiraceae bacterium]